jgi:hypothetical protein
MFARTKVAFKYITSAVPSGGLLSLVQSLNPDFLFGFPRSSKSSTYLLHFLKVCSVAVIVAKLMWAQKFDPLPEELIHCWEDYKFMGRCEEAWIQTELPNVHIYRNWDSIMSQMSPQLIRILYIYKVYPHNRFGVHSLLVRIHLIMGISWDELRAAICPLREILGEDPELLRRLLQDNILRFRQLLTLYFDETFLGRLDCNSLLLELAKAALSALGVMIECKSYWP